MKRSRLTTSPETALGTTTRRLALDSFNTDGGSNTAIGVQALGSNTTGDYNAAIGYGAGANQTSGSNNIYIGDAGVDGESNVIAIGAIASRGTPYDFTYIGGITTLCG